MNHLVCCTCKAQYDFEDPRWQCRCGGLLDLHFTDFFDPEALPNRPANLWRYREAIPIIDDRHIVTLEEGFTPLTLIEWANRTLWIKQEHLFPSGSYKDRGATVLISRAKELGIARVVEDSSGNAGAAVAAYAARAGIACDIYVPEHTSPGKLAQVQLYGAGLHRVSGTREDTAAAVLKAAEQNFYASHVWNPFFFHGTKTFAYEIWEQLAFRAPDTVIIPTGNGTLLIGAHLGFRDLEQRGLIPKIPRLIAVQAAACAPLVPDNRAPTDTIAEGIAIAEPARIEQIREAVRDSQGDILTVDDTETLDALRKTAAMGFYIEPTSATAIAAFEKYRSEPGEIVVAPLTGHGLKSTEKLLKLTHA